MSNFKHQVTCVKDFLSVVVAMVVAVVALVALVVFVSAVVVFVFNSLIP